MRYLHDLIFNSTYIIKRHSVDWLEFNVPFLSNTAISETKGQGWRVILTQ